MCHHAASSISQGLNVLYITLEMAEEKIAERIDANLMNITIDDLHDIPKDVFEKKIKKVKKSTSGRLIVKEYPPASANVNHFRNLLSELAISILVPTPSVQATIFGLFISFGILDIDPKPPIF
jgi:hypothetical protein